MGGCASAARQESGAANLPLPLPQAGSIGVIVHCATGHTSALWYELGEEGSAKLLRQAKMAKDGAPFKLHNELSGPDADKGQVTLCELIQAEMTAAGGQGVAYPDLVLVGASEASTSGHISSASAASCMHQLEATFGSTVGRVRLVVVADTQEAQWDLLAAHSLWGERAGEMFEAGGRFGVLGGHRHSMHLAAPEAAPLLWRVVAQSDRLDDLHGLGSTWQGSPAWEQWELSVVRAVKAERQRRAAPVRGCFVLTGANQLAASAAGFGETRITAAEAADRLHRGLLEFTAGEGEAYAAFLAQRAHCKYHVARVTAMHLCRLAHVLAVLFDPTAQLYAPDPARCEAHCEWTRGAFVEELSKPVLPVPRTPVRKTFHVSYGGKPDDHV